MKKLLDTIGTFAARLLIYVVIPAVVLYGYGLVGTVDRLTGAI